MPDLATVGEALFGPRWQTPLAEAMGVSDRTVRRWVAGQTVPPGAWAEIGELCRSRGAALALIAAHLTAPAPGR
jgi:hypothetical protein